MSGIFIFLFLFNESYVSLTVCGFFCLSDSGLQLYMVLELAVEQFVVVVNLDRYILDNYVAIKIADNLSASG